MEELAETGLGAHRGQAGALTAGNGGERWKRNTRNRPAREGKTTTEKDGIKTNDEMEVTRGVVVGWTVWTRVDVEPNEAKV